MLRPLRRVDLPLVEPLDERLGREIDQLDIRVVELTIGNRLPYLYAGDSSHHVLQTVEMLDVEGSDDVDSGVAQDVDVLIALLAH